MSKKVFLIAGEHSGDVLGASLIKAMRAQDPGVQVEGIGGPLMEAEGLKSLLPMDELCVMGLWEVAGQLPRLLKLINGVVEEIEKRQPDVVVTIDLPDFNFEVGKRLKKRGLSKARRVHYVAPSVWAWRPGRAQKIAQFLDGLICLFPFEVEYFTKHNLKTVAVGHPLVESGSRNADGQNFRAANDIGPEEKVLGLFLGSRESELKSMTGPLKESIDVVRGFYPDLQIVVPTLPAMEYHVLQALQGWGSNITVVAKPDAKWEAFAACDAAIAVSGTVGLELAYMGIPHIITYKLHPATWVLLRALVKVQYAHLANILLNKGVVPEYLQGKSEPVGLSKGILRLFKSDDFRKAQQEEFIKIQGLLGEGQAKTPSAKAAEFVLAA
jgi:lipid-A-disaccharide synthase